jgi:hypothetical protein
MGSSEAPIATEKTTPDRKGTLLRRVPGPVRPRREVLEEVEKYAADLRSRLDPVLHFLYVPDPRKLYRWKVELACGHITELLTCSADDFPDDRRHRDPVHRTFLNPGEMWCRDEAHGDEPRPFGDITEWVSSEVKEFPADPVQPPDGWEPDVWTVIRHDEPHRSRFWRVRLACGHEQGHVVTDVEWTPADGPKVVTVERAEEMRAEMEAYWASEPAQTAQEEIRRTHRRKMVDLRFPRPEPEQECWTCPRAVAINGYQRIGWLIPPPKAPKPAKTKRELLEERVARAEAEASRLRRELDELD